MLKGGHAAATSEAQSPFRVAQFETVAPSPQAKLAKLHADAQAGFGLAQLQAKHGTLYQQALDEIAELQREVAALQAQVQAGISADAGASPPQPQTEQGTPPAAPALPRLEEFLPSAAGAAAPAANGTAAPDQPLPIKFHAPPKTVYRPFIQVMVIK